MFTITDSAAYEKERVKQVENLWPNRRVKYYKGLDVVAGERAIARSAVSARIEHMEKTVEGYYNQIKNLQDTIAKSQQFIANLEADLEKIDAPFDSRIAELRKSLKIDEIPQDLVPRTI